MYSDNASALIAAYKSLGILRKPAPPGDSKANGVIENLNRRIQEGTRAALILAGLPICWWSFAVQHWTFLRNIAPRSEPEEGQAPETTSAYYKRYGEPFTGEILPFGVGVFYYPNKTKYKHQHKFQSRLSYGILVGYGVDPGND